jgi:hypothetical protein
MPAKFIFVSSLGKRWQGFDRMAHGELGILASEEDLAAAIDCLLDQIPPDSEQLSAAVHARFGR